MPVHTTTPVSTAMQADTPQAETAAPADTTMQAIDPDREKAFLIKLANTRMPFGRYQGRYLVDLPEPYVVWFRGQGFPSGELGTMLASMYEIKANGLEGLLRPLIRR